MRILWIVLAALLLVSAAPLWLYHQQVIQLSDQKLQDTERVQQSEITRSIASETLEFVQGVHGQLVSARQMLALTGWIADPDDPSHAPQIARMLQDFAENNHAILYVIAVNQEARGPSAIASDAGGFHADTDPFVQAKLKQAFAANYQSIEYMSEPFALGQYNRPAVVMSVPLLADGHFTGMLAAVVSLDQLQTRLHDESVHDLTVFVVDKDGRLVAYPDSREFFPGRDLTHNSPLVQQFRAFGGAPATINVQFRLPGKSQGGSVDMIGTFSPISPLHWAVIAQRSLADARADAGVRELTTQALSFLVGVTFVALLLGYLFAIGITRPIQGLVHSTRAISRAEFHQRVPVRGAAEISELAETFNNMAGDIEQYVDQLKDAASQNRELFLGSIRMLAAAIDEKDPYTRGHSGRVAKYSMIIADGLGVNSEDLDRLRISALLHDVGKIGVDDRVLKKPGKLTEEEFDLMKQHTVKGANIMRPVAQLRDVLPGIELHHERMDGGGYPYGLRGEQIPLMARIIAVADTLDAITTNRPYQSAMDLDYAMERIRSLSVVKFDPDVVASLDAAVREGRLRLTATLVEV